MPRALTPSQTAYAAKMPEDELEGNVAALCKTLRVRRYHTHRSQHSPAGFPDDVFVGNGLVVYRELKRQSGKVSAEQQAWLDDLEAAGQDVGVWRPVDWFSGVIEETLRSLVAPRR